MKKSNKSLDNVCQCGCQSGICNDRVRGYFIYARTSFKGSFLHTSPERQRLMCEGYIYDKGGIVLGFYCDRALDTTPFKDREELQKLLKAIKSNPDKLIVCESVDRITRGGDELNKAFLFFKSLGIQIIPLNNEELFLEEYDERSRFIIGEQARRDKDLLKFKLEKVNKYLQEVNKSKNIVTYNKGGKSFGRKSMLQKDGRYYDIIQENINSSISEIREIIKNKGIKTDKNSIIGRTSIHRIKKFILSGGKKSYSTGSTFYGRGEAKEFIKENKVLFVEYEQQWYVYIEKEGFWLGVTETKLALQIDSFLDKKGLKVIKSSNITEVLHFVKLFSYLTRWPLVSGVRVLFKNGLFDIQNKEFIGFSKDYFIRYKIPIEYKPLSKEEIRKGLDGPIYEWLLKVTRGDEGVVKLLLSFLYFTLINEVSNQRYLELIGPGGTGKSTFVTLATAVIGKGNVHVTDLSSLENNRFELANIINKLLLVINDAEKYSKEPSRLKNLTGGDLVRIEKKYVQTQGTLNPQVMIIIAANESIHYNDFSNAISRRRITIPFLDIIKESDRETMIKIDLNGEYTGKLAEDLNLLINLLIEMDRKEAEGYIRDPYGKVPSLLKVKDEVMIQTNPLYAFISACIIPFSESEVPLGSYGDMWSISWIYGYYCEKHGVQKMGVSKLGSRIKNLIDSEFKWGGVVKTRDKAGVKFKGLGIRIPESLATQLLSLRTETIFICGGFKGSSRVDIKGILKDERGYRWAEDGYINSRVTRIELAHYNIIVEEEGNIRRVDKM